MAIPSMTKVTTVPWPVLAGASALLHAGALMIGLPQILPVDNFGASSVTVPITLVEEGDVQVVAAPSQVVSPTQPPLSQPGGPSAAEKPAQPQTSPAQQFDASDARQTVTAKPEHDNTLPSNTPDHQSPGQTQPEVTDIGEGSQRPSGPTQVTVVGDVPVLQEIGGFRSNENKQPPSPEILFPVILTIPSTHNCPQGSITSEMILDIAISDQGTPLSLNQLLDQYDGSINEAAVLGDQSPDEKIADCLLGIALQANEGALRFQPAKELNNIGEWENRTTNWGLRVQFQ
ncbi:MAG: hypothetical protein F6K31_00465 [Symploca sp. SIO2G7]|nr:hypothetical protein [Symploca sp. SIO2G7]